MKKSCIWEESGDDEYDYEESEEESGWSDFGGDCDSDAESDYDVFQSAESDEYETANEFTENDKIFDIIGAGFFVNFSYYTVYSIQHVTFLLAIFVCSRNWLTPFIGK